MTPRREINWRGIPRRVTVMGLGRFGGGLGVTRWFAARGARVLVTDRQSEADLAGPLQEIADLIESGAVTLHLGEHDERDFTDTDLVIANPAVPRPWENRYLSAARVAGVPISTEIRLVVDGLRARGCARTIGITGTAGKSTTSAMIHHLLERAGARSHLGGNIGGSLLEHLDTIGTDDWIVLELSSAMLYWLGDEAAQHDEFDPFSPRIAVLTNISPNHLDWHGTMEHYERCKHNIVRHQREREGDIAIRGDDLPASPARIQLMLPGEHNQQNARAAVAAVSHATGAAPEQLAPLLSDFSGLPHRLQLIASHDERRFYDDSKSTSPAATVRAIESFDRTARIHLIAGGYDKSIDLSSIAALERRVTCLYTIGQTGAAIADAVRHADRVRRCDELDTAVRAAFDRMAPGDILLLSPGCASWDQFENFEARGRAFVRAVESCLHRPENE